MGKIILVISTIFLLIILSILWHFRTLFGYGSYPYEIENFKLDKTQVQSTKPIYFQVDGALRFSENGLLNYDNPIIWNNKIEKAFVSPNSEFILILNSDELIILSSKGEVKGTIKPVESIYNFKDKTEMGEVFWRDESIQWDRFSRGFYLIKDTKYEFVGSQLFSDKASLYYYDLTSKNTKMVLEKFPAYHYFFSPDYHYLYYSQPTEEENLKLTRYNILDNENVDIIPDTREYYNTYEKNILGDKNTIFYNFNVFYFGDSWTRTSYLQDKVIIIKNSTKKFDGGLYIYQNNNFKHILRARDGYHSLKGVYYNINLNDSYFLPGSRFFIFDIDSKDYKGKIALDTDKLIYTEVPENLFIYFNINSYDTAELVITDSGIENPSRIVNDAIRKKINAFR